MKTRSRKFNMQSEDNIWRYLIHFNDLGRIKKYTKTMNVGSTVAYHSCIVAHDQTRIENNKWP